MSIGAIGQYAIGELSRVGEWTVTAETGTFTLDGQAVGFLRDIVSAVGVGEFTLEGQAAVLQFDRALLAGVGGFALDGQIAELRSGLEPGVYTMDGQAVTVRTGRMLTSVVGEFTLSGQAAALPVTVLGGVGTFVLTGQDAAVLATRKLYPTTETGELQDVYSQFGFAALGEVSLGGSRLYVAPETTTYRYSGFDTILRQGFALDAAGAEFVSTGFSVDLEATRYVYPETGVYIFDGQVAGALLAMNGALGEFELTGNDASFNRVRRRIRGFARSGGSIMARAS